MASCFFRREVSVLDESDRCCYTEIGSGNADMEILSEMGEEMINFINSFVSYGLLMLITVAICGFGVFLGITLRKRKDAAQTDAQEPGEAS